MIKIYGSKMCPDCRALVELLDSNKVAYEFKDINGSLNVLKEFLALRDTHKEFDRFKEAGKIGIPCLVCEDGAITHDWISWFMNQPQVSLESKIRDIVKDVLKEME